MYSILIHSTPLQQKLLYPPANNHNHPPPNANNQNITRIADLFPPPTRPHLSQPNIQPLPRKKMTDRASSPTPSERKRLDADAKAKEQEEQSKLPYKWTQTIADLEVTIEVPGNFKGKDLDVAIKKNGVKAGIKGKEAIIEV
jgi:HSP20 family molecular chaperone IbpA